MIFVVVLFSCNHQSKKIKNNLCFANNFSQHIEKVSIKNMERIKELNGQFIEVDGILHHYFEDGALYPSKHADTKDALWVKLKMPATVSDSLLQTLSEKQVTLIGKVDTSHKGHYSGYMAALDSVFCIKEK